MEFSPHSPSLEAEFHRLTKLWHQECGYSSNMTFWMQNRHYQAILALGPDVLPIIIEDMRTTPDWWFHALEKLTGYRMPVDNETEAGRLQVLTDKWLAWWDAHAGQHSG